MRELWPVYHPDVPGFLQALAETPELRRLKEVGMNCGCEYTAFPRFRRLRPYSRFSHSMGVGLIVWHFTGDPAQAVAGALHDIATPVFAHVVDFLRGDHLRQEATEERTASPSLRAFRPFCPLWGCAQGMWRITTAIPLPTMIRPASRRTGWNTRWGIW